MTDGDATPIPDDEWDVIVKNVPLVSVDLLVLHGDRVVLGERTNEPAKGEWFVPGGAVFKHESLKAAVHRVAMTELGCDVTIERRLGVYEHFYETSDIDDSSGKHYVPVAYVVTPTSDGFSPDDQHSAIRTVELPVEAGAFHPYVMQYLRDIGAVEPTT